MFSCTQCVRVVKRCNPYIKPNEVDKKLETKFSVQFEDFVSTFNMLSEMKYGKYILKHDNDY